MQREVLSPLADILLSGEISPGCVIHIDAVETPPAETEPGTDLLSDPPPPDYEFVFTVTEPQELPPSESGEAEVTPQEIVFMRNRRAIPFRSILCLLLFCGVGAWAQSPLTLFNGTSLLGWNARGLWTTPAGVISTSGTLDRGILTAVPFQDFSLSFDYQESQPMNARLRIWAPKDGPGGSYIDLDEKGQAAGLGGIEGASISHLAATAGVWRHVQVEAASGRITVRVDGQSAGTAGGGMPRAGYLGWQVAGNGTFQVRGVTLVLAGLAPAFNGTDLSSWKSVARAPKNKSGLGHDLTKNTDDRHGRPRHQGPHSEVERARWSDSR